MKPIDTLIKYLHKDSKNIAEFLDEEQLKDIAENVIIGYEIDDSSRSDWLMLNKKASDMVNGRELINDGEKDFPIPNAAKVVYPLTSNAIIQSSAMMIMHLVHNDKVASCAVLGQDDQISIPNPKFNPQQPQSPSNQPSTLEWRKAGKAARVEDFLSYELLIESDSWLEDEHRLMSIVCGWGVGFKEVYYDDALQKNCSELIAPEDVIINNNLYGTLEKARRITIRQYLSKNDIIEKIRSGYFLDIDFNDLKSDDMDNIDRKNDSRETNPVIECFKQFCYLDLDNDEYEEPYYVYITHEKKRVLGIQPAFDIKSIKLNTTSGQIQSITPILNIVDRHFISNPEGKFWSYGLNHLLFHQNKSITTVLRQLLDAGTLANASASTGFVSKALKTRERTLRVSMGQYIPVDLPQGVSIESQIMTLPVREPSQVLLALLQLLIETAKESGFLTDLLTGQTEMQNVPATTVLATIEQGTRAFKPVVQKMFRSLKKEFKLWFSLYAKYLNKERYVRFQDKSFSIIKDDFDDSLDISPVADPTMSSEAHKYARLHAMQTMMQIPDTTNLQEAAKRFYTDLQFPNPEALVGSPPPPPPPDPKLIEAQTKQQLAPVQAKAELVKAHAAHNKTKVENRKADIEQAKVGILAQDSKIKNAKLITDAHRESIDAQNDVANTVIEAYNANTERQRIEALDRESRKPTSSS